MKIVYMGTGPFAKGALEALYNSGNEIALVVTQPDKPNSRRGKEIIFGQVKQFALDNNITLYQPSKASSEESVEYIKSFGADVGVVCSFGQLLKSNLLNAFEYGCLNIHASLLEKYRGAAPINRVIMDGEKESGVTVMYMDEGLDTGDMMIKQSVEITDEDNFATLSEKLKECGSALIIEALNLLKSGNAPRIKQDDSKSNYAQKILKSDKYIVFDKSARDVFNHIRALNPTPSAECRFGGKLIKIFDVALCENDDEDALAGSIISCGKEGMKVKCQSGAVIIKTLKPEGKGLMPANAFYNGIKDKTLRFEKNN